MNILVTGAAGYIGTKMVKALVDNGYDVIAFDKCLFPSGEKYVDSLNVTYIKDDLRNIGDYDFLSQVDVIIHLAGFSNDPTAQAYPETNISYNIDATRELVEAANKYKVPKIMFASSASVYGFNDKPGLTEDEELFPQSYYASSKYEGEKIILNEFEGKKVIFRQATVGGYSPRMRWDLVVNTMFMCAVRDNVISVHAGGEASRPLIDIDDVVEAYIVALEHKDWSSFQDYPVFNLAHVRNAEEGNGAGGYRIASLALWIKDIVEDGLPIGVDVIGDWQAREGRSYDISCDKLFNTFHWLPARTVKHTVANLIDAYKNNSKELTKSMNSAETKNIAWMDALIHAEKIVQRDGQLS